MLQVLTYILLFVQNITGHLKAELNNETSGLACSHVNKGFLYIHNDSGDTSRFFLISEDGALKATYTFNARVLDCEDMAVGTYNGKSYVYIGDIGDNAARRPYVTVYRIEEPTLQKDTKVNAIPLHLKYPDGPRDAETLMTDPIEKLLYIISKREDSIKVYTTPLAYKPGDTVTLTPKATLFFKAPKKGSKWITGGSISSDGKSVLIKSYSNVYYWERKAKEPIWQLLMTTPRELLYKVEEQGEAIGFTTDGKGYYTISEGVHAPIYYYKIK